MLLGQITVLDPLNITGTDMWATIDEQLHDHTPDLGAILVPMVQARTPVWTGALQGSITYEAYENPEPPGGEEDLVYVYAPDDAQLAAWNRIYVQYVEGEPLGLHTYTNPARGIYFNTAQAEGFDATLLWAVTWIDYANTLAMSGAGVPF